MSGISDIVSVLIVVLLVLMGHSVNCCVHLEHMASAVLLLVNARMEQTAPQLMGYAVVLQDGLGVGVTNHVHWGRMVLDVENHVYVRMELTVIQLMDFAIALAPGVANTARSVCSL